MASPTERVLKLAAFVRERPDDLTLSRITAAVPGYPDVARDELGDIIDAKEWERVRKALQRDLADLEAQLGIALTYVDSDHCYRLEPPFFTAEERRLLISACATVEVRGVDADGVDPIGAAVDPSSHEAIVWIDRHAATFQAARLERRSVCFSYRGRLRTIDPYAIGVRRNRWYVVGRDHDHDALRQFRLDRIEAEPPAALLAAGFELPEDFHAPSALRLDPNDWGTDPPVIARVRVAAGRVPAFQRELGGVVVASEPDHVIVELTVRHRASFRVRVTAFGSDAVVVAPDELVDDVVGWLTAIAGVG